MALGGGLDIVGYGRTVRDSFILCRSKGALVIWETGDREQILAVGGLRASGRAVPRAGSGADLEECWLGGCRGMGVSVSPASIVVAGALGSW